MFTGKEKIVRKTEEMTDMKRRGGGKSLAKGHWPQRAEFYRRLNGALPLGSFSLQLFFLKRK